MTYVSYPNALKAFRRNVHVYGADWRGAVVSDTHTKTLEAFAEAGMVFDSSSLNIERASMTELKIYLKGGSELTFITGNDRLRGMSIPHIIFLFEPDQDTLSIATAVNRPFSLTIPQEACRMDMSAL